MGVCVCLVHSTICIALLPPLGHMTEGMRVSIAVRETNELRQRLVVTRTEFQHIVVYDAIDNNNNNHLTAVCPGQPG